MNLDLTSESRYARQELITWWDQTRLRSAKVLVVGAGALGNEIVKNLGLLGVGNIDIVDMDEIERSNLSRCALFRDEDEGRLKSDALAEAVMKLNPDVIAHSLPVSVMTLGLGNLVKYDVVIAGLDNREARLWINRACRKLSKIWVDGAIEGLQGLARVFLPEGACYECTLGEVDFKLISARKSCSLLSVAEMETGKTPTNSTTASIIAGIEVQEAVKIIVGRADLLGLRNQAFIYTGDTLDSYVTGYQENEWCMSHEQYQGLEVIDAPARIADLFDRPEWSNDVEAVEFENELILGRRCLACGWQNLETIPLALLQRGDGQCPECNEVLTLDAQRTFSPDEPLLKQPLTELHLIDNDVVTVRGANQRAHYVWEGSK